MADEDLSRLDEWFGRILAGLSPAARHRAATRLATALLRANLKRISENVEPDGAPMERRKPRLDRRGRLRQRAGGKMFRGLRTRRNWKIDADEDGLEIMPASGLVDRIGAISQFGETSTVGRLRDGKRIRHRYAVRRLLGFAADDDALVTDIAADLIESAR